MKRPEGFDPATKRQAVPPPKSTPAKKATAARSAPAKSPAAKSPAAKPTAANPTTARPAAAKPVVARPEPARGQRPAAASAGRVDSPRTRETPAVRRPDREARIELRKAARERRRYERTEVRRFTRRARNRRIGWITAGGVVVVLGAMLLIAVYSPLLSLKTVTVEGTSRVDAAEVQDAVADQLGTPLALVDFDKITRKLGALPLIRSYTTETVPPDTIVIHVTEREPVGIVENGSSWNLVDPAGVVIQTVTDQPKDLPIISAGAADSASFAAAASVLLELPADLLKRVGSISASTQDDVSFTFGDTNQKVIWGNGDRGTQKATALKALIASQKKNHKVDFNVSSPDIALVIDQQ